VLDADGGQLLLPETQLGGGDGRRRRRRGARRRRVGVVAEALLAGLVAPEVLLDEGGGTVDFLEVAELLVAPVVGLDDGGGVALQVQLAPVLHAQLVLAVGALDDARRLEQLALLPVCQSNSFNPIPDRWHPTYVQISIIVPLKARLDSHALIWNYTCKFLSTQNHVKDNEVNFGIKLSTQ